MKIITKTLMVAIAATFVSTAGVPIAATTAEASHYYGHKWKPKRHYKRHYRKRHCGWKRVKHWDGYHWVWYRKWVCR